MTLPAPKMTIDEMADFTASIAASVTPKTLKPEAIESVALVLKDGDHLKIASLAAFFNRIRPIADALRACVVDETIASLAVKIHANPGAVSAIFAIIRREEAKTGGAA